MSFVIVLSLLSLASASYPIYATIDVTLSASKTPRTQTVRLASCEGDNAVLQNKTVLLVPNTAAQLVFGVNEHAVSWGYTERSFALRCVFNETDTTTNANKPFFGFTFNTTCNGDPSLDCVYQSAFSTSGAIMARKVDGLAWSISTRTHGFTGSVQVVGK